MKRIGLSGISGGAAVSALSQGEIATAVGRLTAAEAETEVSVYVQNTAQERVCTPLSVTVSGGWNGSGFGSGFAPAVLSDFAIIGTVTGGKVVLSGLDRYNSYAPAIYDDARVEFRRISGGQMVLVGTARMTDAAFPLQGSYPSDQKAVITGTVYRHKFDSWNRRNVPYWFAVSAVGADGLLGTRSAWTAFTPTGSDSGIDTLESAMAAVPSRTSGGALAAPETVTLTALGQATLDIAWSQVAGAAGYVVHIAYSDPATWPETGGEFGLADLQGDLPQAGDMVIWRKEITSLTADMFCSRVYGDSNTWSGLFPSFTRSAFPTSESSIRWEIVAWDEAAKPAETLGGYYLRQSIPAGITAGAGVYWSGGSGQTYYHRKVAGDVLVIDVWIRAAKPITMRFTSGQPGETNQTFDVGTEWQHYHLRSDYVSNPAGTMAYRWSLAATAGGEDLDIDYAQLRVYLEGADYGALRPDLAQSLLPGQKLRDHALIKTRPKTYAAKTVTAPPGEGFKGNTCGMHMETCRQHECIPWVQLEWSLFREDWLIWAEWLTQTQGDFDKILLELGNENWNPLAAFWTMPTMKDAQTGATLSAGAVYGMMTTMIRSWLQESPWWDSLKDRLEIVLGGWIIGSFGEDAYLHCPAAKYVTVASYNGGWESGSSTRDESGDSFCKMLGYAGGENSLRARETALASVVQTLGTTVGVDVFHDVYEGGPGYQLNGLNGISLTADEAIVQECVLKSRASATAQLDAICTAWKRGWLSNWFVLGRGSYWTSHREDGAEYLTYAVGRLIGASMGREFRIHETHAIAMTATEGTDDIAVYAFESLDTPGKWLFAVLNRALDRSVLGTDDELYDAVDSGLRAITLHTGFAAATGCRVFRGGLGNMRAHNRYPQGTRLTAAGTYEADPLCIDFDMAWHDLPVPEDVGRLTIGADFGAETGGLRGGNFMLIEFSGLERG